MSGDDKTLKITHVHDVKGSDKAVQASKDLGKSYKELENTVKMTQKQLEAWVGLTKKITEEERGHVRVLQDLDKTVRATRQSIELMLQLDRRWGQQIEDNSKKLESFNQKLRESKTLRPDVQNGAYGGGPNSYDRGGYGLNTGSPKGPRNWGGIMSGIGAGFAMAGHLVAQGTGMYANYEQHAGMQDVRDKTQGLENLARSQSYRNYKYNESQNSPVGFVAMKNASTFRVRTRDSASMGVEEGTGQLTGADTGSMRSESGMSIGGTAAKMSGESRVIEAQRTRGIGGMIGGGLLAAGGIAAAIGGGIMLAPALGAIGAAGGIGAGISAMGGGAALGGMAGAGALAGGVAGIAAGFKEALGGFFEEKSARKKLQTGELAAQQSEGAVRAEQMSDEILAIRTSRLQAFQELAPQRVAMGRQTIGTFSGAGGGGYSGAEMGAMQGGLLRGFGSFGQGLLGGVMGAGNSGMSAGAASSIMGNGAQAGNGGSRSLERVIAAGFAQGWKQLDMTYFEKIGTAIAENMYSGEGGVRGRGGGAAMFSGMGPNPTNFGVGEQLRGTGMNSQVFRGNAYFASRSMLDASNILGSSATGLEIGALGKASFQDLLGGNDKLAALGISGSQRKQMLGARTNALGSVLGGDKRIAGMISDNGGDFQQTLQSIAKGLRKGDKGAKSQLDRIAAVASEMLGEDDFGGLRGMLRQMGVSDDDISRFDKGAGKFDSKISGTSAGVMAASEKRRHRAAKEGEAELANPYSVAEALRNLEGKGSKSPEDVADIKALTETLRTGKGSYASTQALEHVSVKQGEAAAAAGGYGGTQQLLKELGGLGAALSDLTKIINNAKPAIRKLGGKV